MKKTFVNLISIAIQRSTILLGLLFFVTGCGHTLYHKVEGTGVYARIPLPNGGSLIEVAGGDINITSATLRGGATLDQNASKGGTLGSVSIARHTYLSTEPAMNEGNIRDVLMSKDTDSKTKQLIAEYLISRKQDVAPSASVTSVNSASATGNKESIPHVKPTKTGFDNAVDKVTQVAPQVVKPIVQNTKQAVTHISDNVESSTNNVVNSFWDNIKSIIIWIVLGIFIIAAVLIFFGIKFKKNNPTTDITENTDDNKK